MLASKPATFSGYKTEVTPTLTAVHDIQLTEKNEKGGFQSKK